MTTTGTRQTKTSRKKSLNARLRELRADWKRWNTCTDTAATHIDHVLAACEAQCGRCEGCVSASYRTQKLQQIEAEAAPVKAELEALR